VHHIEMPPHFLLQCGGGTGFFQKEGAMITKRCLTLRQLLPMFAALVVTTAAVAQDRPMSDRSTRQSGSSSSAPVGHRQPTAADVRKTQPIVDPEQEKRERELDKKLQICRGC
jgi:hypothetical protein